MLQRRFPHALDHTLKIWLGALAMALMVSPCWVAQAADDVVVAKGTAASAPALPSKSAHAQRKAEASKTASATVANAKSTKHVPPSSWADDVAWLKAKLAQQDELLSAQQKQIEKLTATLEEQRRFLEQKLGKEEGKPSTLPSVGEYASLAPVIPGGPPRGGSAAGGPAPGPGSPTPSPQESIRSYVERVDQLSKTVNSTVTNLAGFKFSGDFRLMADGAFRSSNEFAGPVQNARGNYRARFNVDKALNDRLSFHFQLGSGVTNSPLTYNTDFGGFANRGPVFIGEAWASYHPSSNIDLLGGRIPELFADDSRFLFKEDIRFDGIQENFKIPVGSNPLGITRVELRAGQYVLTNPNVPVLPSASSCASANPAATCAYLNAGYLPGQKVRDADLFHQGFAIYADIKPGWHHQFGGDLQWYRNQNQIALAATAAGAALVTGTMYGTNSILPVPGTGTATTTPGGATFTASQFQVAHLKYRLSYEGWKLKDHAMPAYVEFHGARNVGAGFLRNAWEGLVNFGDTQKAGDVRFLYAYAAKEGNSMISEVTDDYMGTNTGVNMRTHEIRIDVGLSRFLTWQNLFFIQKEISSNDPARHFYVPIQAGTATQYRLQTQLQFKF
jgi:hypothetical protein